MDTSRDIPGAICKKNTLTITLVTKPTQKVRKINGYNKGIVTVSQGLLTKSKLILKIA